MYKPEEYVVYGANGVCLITELCPSPFDPADERLFYVMKPVTDRGTSVIYTPVDNEAVPMRPLLSAEELDALVARIGELPTLEIPIEKKRRDVYKAVMASVDPEQYVRLIKTVRLRRALAREKRKQLPEIDNEYDLVARRCLYTEIALILGIEQNAVEGYLRERIGGDAI